MVELAARRVVMRYDLCMTDSIDSSDAVTPDLLSPDALLPGTRVRIIKQVARQGQAFTSAIEGTVVKAEQRKTGSWFAHSKDDRLWLDRLEIHKDDGEIYICNVEPHTRIEILSLGEGEVGA